MKVEVRYKFPCGFEIFAKAQSGFMETGKVSFDTEGTDSPTECPLHGKECPPLKLTHSESKGSSED